MVEPSSRSEIDLCRIVCESAAVTVGWSAGDHPARLRLTSERSGRELVLDTELLDLLCGLTPDQASELVRLRTEK